MQRLVYAPFKAAVQGEVDTRALARASLRVRMQRLVHGSFKGLAQGKPMIRAIARGPFLVVLDGLDECDDKREVQELIDGMLLFFSENPFIPLRVFVTSRVEQHIQSRLSGPGVYLDNLVDHCSDDDIATFLNVVFEDERRRNPVVQAYVQQHGEWPSVSDKQKLVKHIGGSFIFASAIFKFIMDDGSPMTPMDLLPLALKMNPGLDGLYMQTLARSEHLRHFPNIISTIALLLKPLPTSGIAELLGIDTYEVVNVLVNLQAIIQVPGTDDIPVTLCHTSLRDFLTTQSRSGRFFAHPTHHVHLFLRCLECELKIRRHRPGSFVHPTECSPAIAYALTYSTGHLNQGNGLFKLPESDSAIQLCREAVELNPGTPEIILGLANVVCSRAIHTESPVDLEEAIGLYREVLKLRLSPHPDRTAPLNNLGNALLDRHRRTGAMADLEEGISLLRESLQLVPPPHPDCSLSLNGLANALLERHRRTRAAADLEEATSLHRALLRLRPAPHPNRSISLNNLGNVLLYRYNCTANVGDIGEATSLFREAVALRPSPHPGRSVPLSNLALSLQVMFKESHALPNLEEAIIHCRELVGSRYYIGHRERVEWLSLLASLLQMRFDKTGQEEDLQDIASLKEEASRLTGSSAT
jgi:tetratricopeptide (TPR) repeat protein